MALFRNYRKNQGRGRECSTSCLFLWGVALKVTTRKSYPFRSFYNSKKERLAFYVIEVVGEEPQVLIYSGFLKGVDSIGLKKSHLEEDQFRALELLESHLPKDLAEAIFKYARKDLGCRKGFSLKSFIKWKEAHQR